MARRSVIAARGRPVAPVWRASPVGDGIGPGRPASTSTDRVQDPTSAGVVGRSPGTHARDRRRRRGHGAGPARARRRSSPAASFVQEQRKSSAHSCSRGLVGAHARAHMGYPAPVARRTLRRVAGAAQHRGVGDVERRTVSGQRDYVVDGEVGGAMGWPPVARAPVPVLTPPGAEHAGAESLPGARAVQSVVPAAVGLPSVVSAATTRAAGDDTTDRAQLHPRIVDGVAGAVYSPAVLPLRGQFPNPSRLGHSPRLARSSHASARLIGVFPPSDGRARTGDNGQHDQGDPTQADRLHGRPAPASRAGTDHGNHAPQPRTARTWEAAIIKTAQPRGAM